MADIQKNTNSGLAMLALIVSAITLPIAIVAYNRSGENLDETIERNTEVVVDEARETATEAREIVEQAGEEIAETAAQVQARAELETRLIALRTQIAADEVTDESVEEVQAIRADLREAYANATGEIKEDIDAMDADLARLEAEMRQDTAAALLTIENVIEGMRRDVQSDDENE